MSVHCGTDMSSQMNDNGPARTDEEIRAWKAYYEAQATLFAELAEGSTAPDQQQHFREQENRWREKARVLQSIAAE